MDSQGTDFTMVGQGTNLCFPDLENPVIEDDTPDDLRNISFDEWDKSFIASFEENMFNLIDDGGKNLGFLLSPKGKGNPVLFSPDGKKMSPADFRKTFSKHTPVMGSTLQGFPASNQSQQALTALPDHEIKPETTSSLQPKKQLFPCEKSLSISDPVVQQMFLSSEFAEFNSTRFPLRQKQSKLQAARSKFNHVLQCAVQKTAEKVKELRDSGYDVDSEVKVKHPELRQALVADHKNTATPDVKLRDNQCLPNSKKKPFMSKSNSLTRMKTGKSVGKVTKYSRIQPKRPTTQCYQLARF